MVLSAFLRAVEELGMEMDKIAVVSGIGCSGRIGGYIKGDSIHVAHGRALPVALGAKLARPDMTVVAFMGDGDAFSIGGNHLLHAARRNDDVKAIVVNNLIFGMTGGQISPTTPPEAMDRGLMEGKAAKELDGSVLCALLGASYVARWPNLDFLELKDSIKVALTTKGFALVEALSQCPVQFGKYTVRDSLGLMKWIKEKTIGIDEAKRDGDTHGKILTGEFAKPGEGVNPKLRDLILR